MQRVLLFMVLERKSRIQIQQQSHWGIAVIFQEINLNSGVVSKIHFSKSCRVTIPTSFPWWIMGRRLIWLSIKAFITDGTEESCSAVITFRVMNSCDRGDFRFFPRMDNCKISLPDTKPITVLSSTTSIPEILLLFSFFKISWAEVFGQVHTTDRVMTSETFMDFKFWAMSHLLNSFRYLKRLK